MPITQIIFDCDGVLIDSELLIAEVEAGLRTELGFPITVEEYIRKFVGLSTRSREYTDDLVKLPDNYYELVSERVRESMHKNLRAMPGVRGFIDCLSIDKSIASSSTPEELAFSLKIAGLYEDFVGRIFSVTMVEHPKPAPDVYLYVAKQTNHKPEDCLVIEDTVVGVTAAHRAGMTVIGFTGASHNHGNSEAALRDAGASSVCSSFAELPELLLRMQIEYS